MRTPVFPPAILLLVMMIVILPGTAADGSDTMVLPSVFVQPGTSVQPAIPVQPDVSVRPDTSVTPADNAESGTGDETDTTKEPQMNAIFAIGCAFIGTIISFLLPVFAKYGAKVADKKTILVPRQEVISIAAPFAMTALQALCIAIIIIAYTLSQKTPIGVDEWYVPFIIGFGSDTTLQKIKAGNP